MVAQIVERVVECAYIHHNNMAHKTVDNMAHKVAENLAHKTVGKMTHKIVVVVGCMTCYVVKDAQ